MSELTLNATGAWSCLRSSKKLCGTLASPWGWSCWRTGRLGCMHRLHRCWVKAACRGCGCPAVSAVPALLEEQRDLRPRWEAHMLGAPTAAAVHLGVRAGDQLHLADVTVAPKPAPEGSTAPEAPHTQQRLCLRSGHLGAYLCRGRGQCDLELPPTPAVAGRKGRGLRNPVGLHSRCLDHIEEHRVWILAIEKQLQVQHLETHTFKSRC